MLEGIKVLEGRKGRILSVIKVKLLNVPIGKKFLEEGIIKEKGVIKEVLLEKLLNNMVANYIVGDLPRKKY
tara:strand:+ start:2954 stop:3166 length:213 start_codon:yes stop_codon:yes gene_type:complete